MPKVETNDEYLLPKQVSQLVCVAEQTLAVWRCDGVGPSYYRVGRAIRYKKSDVLAWLESRRVTVASPALAGA